MPLLLRTHYRLAIESLKHNRTRSLLTCLGIAIGVASVILILSLMGSVNRLINKEVDSLGSDLILVRPAVHRNNVDSIISELTSASQYLGSNLTLSDVDTIKKLDNVTAAAPLAASVNTLKGEHTVDSATVVATNEDIQPILNLTLHTGSFISNDFSQNTAVIGHSLALDLFRTEDAIGQTFSMLGQKYLVIGVLDEINTPLSINNIDFDKAALIHTKFFGSTKLQIQQISVKVKNTSSLEPTAQNIADILTKNKSGDQNFSVTYGDNITHPAGSLIDIVSKMLTLVAGISLLVGGIGIMNIMLVSVAERTHEIGIRKAVGAANLNIFLQFLFESLVLSFLGGLLGLGLGYLLAFLVSLITPFAPFFSWDILLSVLYISIFVGTVFGLYPAIKASRKTPIDSLRYSS